MRPARTLTTLLAGLALTSLAAPAALAQEFVIVSTYDSSSSPYLTTRDVGRGLAQSFVATATGDIYGVEIQVGIKPNGDSSLFANIVWSLHEWQSGDYPLGQMLASGSFTVSNGDQQGTQFKSLSFGGGTVPLVQGTQYVLFVGSGTPPTAQAGGTATSNPNLYWHAGDSGNSDSYASGVGYEMLSPTTFQTVSPATDFRLNMLIWPGTGTFPCADDTTAPVVSIPSSITVAAGSTSVTVSGTVTDPSGIAELHFDGLSTPVPVAGDGSFTASVPISGQGTSATVNGEALDTCGNQDTFSIQVIYDQTQACVPEDPICAVGQTGTVFYVDLDPAPYQLKCVSNNGTDLSCTVIN